MAVLVQWSDNYSVGIEEIDEQHKVLINLLNEMNEAILQRSTKDVVPEIIAKLMDYTRIHFAVEESLMRILGYENYEEHKKSHRILIQSVTEFMDNLQHDKLPAGFELQHFLKNWLTRHILDVDKRYTDHFLFAGAQTKLQKKSWISRLWE